jgi:hypothetical protein
MRLMRFAIPLTLGVVMSATAPSFAQTKAQEEANEKTVQLSQVPEAARNAAQKELGATPTEAKLVSGTNPQQYELEAKDKSGKEISVHVQGNGTIVKKETE